MKTEESVDVCPCTIEIFKEAYQYIRNAGESNELVSKSFQRLCKYSAWHVEIMLDIWCMCAFIQKDVQRCNIVCLECLGYEETCVCRCVSEGFGNVL